MSKNIKICFNNLPPEIIKEIFLNIKIKHLYEYRLICSFWHIIINEIINMILNIKIKEIEIDNERYSNALNIVIERWYDSKLFCFFYSENKLLNKIDIGYFINKKINFFKDDNEIYEIKRTFNYIEILNELKEATINSVFTVSINDDDADEAIWKTIISITNTDISLEELKNKCYKDKFIKNFMEKYKWYQFKTRQYIIPERRIIYSIGIFVIYPDYQTFCILYASDSV